MIATLMLLAAVMVSLALGVLTAYGTCYGMLQMFHAHTKALAKDRMKAIKVSVLAEQ